MCKLVILLPFNSLFTRVTSVSTVTKAFISGFQTLLSVVKTLQSPYCYFLTFGRTTAEILRLTLRNSHVSGDGWRYITPTPGSSSPELSVSHALPQLGEPKGRTEGPSLAKRCRCVPGCQGRRCCHRLGASWDGGRKAMWRAASIQLVLTRAAAATRRMRPLHPLQLESCLLEFWIQSSLFSHETQEKRTHNTTWC